MEISLCIIFPIPRFLWINSSFLFKYHTTRWQPCFLFSLLYFQGRNPQYYWMSSGVGKKSTDLGPSFWRKLVGKNKCGPSLPYLWNWINLQSLFKALIYDSKADLTLNLNLLREEDDETKPSGASWRAQAKSKMSKGMKWGAPSIFQIEHKKTSSANLFECLRVSWANQIKKTVMEVIHELENTGCV